MLTPEQEKWIAHLSDEDEITIKPLDESAPEKFEAVKRKIQAVMGPEQRVEHCGSTSLGISGQDEIDVYVPVLDSEMEGWLPVLTAAFGSPRSYYPHDRARFVVIEAGKHVDVFLINEACKSWQNGQRFDRYLRAHPEALEAYRLLKEECSGLSTRAYYRRKTEFYNQILELCKT